MRPGTPRAALLLVILLAPAPARAERWPIDVKRSSVKLTVFKAGFLSVFAHDHTIAAPVAEGWVDRSETPGIELRFDVRALRVLDPELSPKKRAAVQTTMQGPEVLDGSRHEEIVFRSKSIDARGSNHWSVAGLLTLRGESRGIRVEVAEEGGRYHGSATVHQREFGITPVSVAGGTVRVKDEVRVEFEIVPSGP